MIEKWIVCKSELPHDPRKDTCLVIVTVGNDTHDWNEFNDWLKKNCLYAYKDSYRRYFEKRQKLPNTIPFNKNLEVLT